MPTPKEELTTKRLQALQPAALGTRYEIADTHVSGLRVRIGDSAVESGDRRRRGKAAKVSYVLLARFKPGANPTRRTLGTFPEIALADARQKAIEWKALIRAGVDPAEEERRNRAEAERERQARRTLLDVLDQYQREKLVHLRRGDATRRALDGRCGLLSGFIDREPSTITRAEVKSALRKRAAKSPVSANRQLAYAKAFFNWCVSEEIVRENPAHSLSKPSVEVPRDRYHSLEELAEIWAAAESLAYPFGPLVKLLIALPMRRQEIAAMPIEELHFDGGDEGGSVWILPAARTKRANALRVPLSPLARSIIMGAISDKKRPKESPFVFSTKGESPVSGFSKAKRRLDAAITRWRTESLEANDHARAMPHWTFHDFRTTFMTLACEDLRIDAAVADRILNHVASATSSKIMRVYNQSELFEPRRQALLAWATLLEDRVIGKDRSNVVRLTSARQ